MNSIKAKFTRSSGINFNLFLKMQMLPHARVLTSRTLKIKKKTNRKKKTKMTKKTKKKRKTMFQNQDKSIVLHLTMIHLHKKFYHSIL